MPQGSSVTARTYIFGVYLAGKICWTNFGAEAQWEFVRFNRFAPDRYRAWLLRGVSGRFAGGRYVLLRYAGDSSFFAFHFSFLKFSAFARIYSGSVQSEPNDLCCSRNMVGKTLLYFSLFLCTYAYLPLLTVSRLWGGITLDGINPDASCVYVWVAVTKEMVKRILENHFV